MNEIDQIRIENLRIYAYHGVYAEENEKGQNFYINAVLETDLRQAGTMDALELSTNYGEVCLFFQRFLTEHTYKLIETAAQKTAEAALLEFPYIRRITLEVRKPEAPIPLPFESVSVRLVRGWKKAYLSCGSNLGNREEYLNRAVETLRRDEKCRVLKVSDWMLTTPYGGVEQENYLNGAIAIDTLYTPEQLLERIHEIERENGRERKVRWGARTLDLDILLYEDCVLYTEALKIPHEDMHHRDFVLAPLAQIAPYAFHPVLRQSVLQLYQEVQRQGEAHILV